ncbi:hypothetical protein GCM10007921_29220 [Tritonibacter mobilis]|nr:hypothetical protein GCM10007921_29220 [Tritonibacter mobilis]
MNQPNQFLRRSYKTAPPDLIYGTAPARPTDHSIREPQATGLAYRNETGALHASAKNSIQVGCVLHVGHSPPPV